MIPRLLTYKVPKQIPQRLIYKVPLEDTYIYKWQILKRVNMSAV